MNTIAPPLSRDVPARAGRREWLALGVLSLALALITIDATVLALAVPFITADLRPSATQMLWIGDAYSFVVAGFLVTMGSLGDRIGRKRLLLTGAVLFAVASVFAAYAPSPGALIMARALLGLAGATLMPSTLSIIRNMFADARQRATAIAVWGAIASSGTALGPIAGGALLAHFWWGSVFLINVPVMAVLLGAGLVLLPESRDPDPGPFDLAGALLSLVGIVALVYALKLAFTAGSPAVIAGAAAVAVFALAWFAVRQRRRTNPMLDLSLFRLAAFSGSVVTNLLSVFALGGILFFLSQYFQLVQGHDPLAAGVRQLPAVAGALLVGVLIGPLLRRFSRAGLATGGLVLAAAGLGALAIGMDQPHYWPLAIALFAIALGIDVAITITTDTVVAAAPKEKSGAASAVSETAFELGIALGIGLLGSVLTAVYRATLRLPGDPPGDIAAATRDSLAGGMAAADRAGADLPAVLDGARTAFVHGMQTATWVAAAFLAAAAVIAWRTFSRHAPRD